MIGLAAPLQCRFGSLAVFKPKHTASIRLMSARGRFLPFVLVLIAMSEQPLTGKADIQPEAS